LAEIRERTIDLKKRKENEKRNEYEKRKNENLSKEKLESYQAINIGRETVSDLPNFQEYCPFSC